MPDALTTTSSLSNLIQQSYDKMVEMSLRSEPLFRRFADKRPVDVTNPGSSVTFQIYKDLARVTGTLSETADVDSVAVPNTKKVSVTLDNRGNAVTVTERLKLESLSNVDPAIADMIAFNMRDSLDALVYQTLVSKATGRFDGTTADDEVTVNGEDITANTGGNQYLKAKDILKAVAKLRGANVQERENGAFIGLVHPDVSYDLRVESAASGNFAWKEPHTYTEAGVGNMWNGEIGIFGGVKFIESPRVEKAAGGTARVITNKALTSNVATLTSAAHGFEVGQTVVVAGVDSTFNGTYTITAVATNTFSYAKTASDVSSTSATGTANTLDHKVLILGKQALLEAVTQEPQTVIGPVTDKLMRFRPVGWKGLLGWNIYRPEARYVITVNSSI